MNPMSDDHHQHALPPWMFPWIGGGGAREGQLIENLVPARVREAHQFAAFMARRCFPVCAVDNQGVIQSEPAPKVTSAEQAAWDSACMLLADYFRGHADPDVYEGRLLRQMDVETDRRQPGVVGPCPSCGGTRTQKKIDGQRRKCQLCRGHGTVLVTPSSHAAPLQGAGESE